MNKIDLQMRIKRLENALSLSDLPYADYHCKCCNQLYIPRHSGNQTIISPSYKRCNVCKEDCHYYKSPEKCWGSVQLKHNPIMDDYKHLCEGHKKMGNLSGWYVSEPIKKDGPIQRMLGENSTDPENIGPKTRLNEDPHYTE